VLSATSFSSALLTAPEDFPPSALASAGRALDGEPEFVVITALRLDQRPIHIIAEKVTSRR
jgi:hypothetical protein